MRLDRYYKENQGRYVRGFTLIEIAILVIVMGFLAGGILVGSQFLEAARIRSQASQIAYFDGAVYSFYQKYEGLPGDLLFVKADREGLITGDGTPSHSDGDGKISPCNLGWQWGMGCETALFWSQLSAVGLISESFTAGNRLADERLQDADVLDVYLPKAAISEDLHVTVWNTDAAEPSPEPRLPYDNYYEISHIDAVVKGKMVDDYHALTPAEAYSLDKKIDDGYPYRGRVVANGSANWPEDAWGTFAPAGPDNCIAANRTYNTREYFKARRALCHLAITFDCCTEDD